MSVIADSHYYTSTTISSSHGVGIFFFFYNKVDLISKVFNFIIFLVSNNLKWSLQQKKRLIKQDSRRDSLFKSREM